jgi:site-specific recombinase XerD
LRILGSESVGRRVNVPSEVSNPIDVEANRLEKAFPVKTRRADDIVKAAADPAATTKDVSPLVLRHTFATPAPQIGISLPTLRKSLGEDGLQSTAICLNLTDVHFQDEFDWKL